MNRIVSGVLNLLEYAVFVAVIYLVFWALSMWIPIRVGG